MKLIKPSPDYFEEYYKACCEAHENGITEWIPFQLDEYEKWKETIIEILDKCEKGEKLPPGVPVMYTWWCIEGAAFIGEIQIRPFLNEEQAKNWGHLGYAVRYSKWRKGYGTQIYLAAIDKLKELGVSPIYVACHKDNVASRRIVEKCGGAFVSDIVDDEGIEQIVYMVKE